MRFCINYNPHSHILNKVDEINIDYKRVQDIVALNQFCQEHINQRINICVAEVEEAIAANAVKDLLDFQKKNKDYNIYLRFAFVNNDLKELLQAYENCKYYFSIGVNDWDRVMEFISLGVTDIYVVEGLGFEIEQVSNIVHKYGIDVRVYPNVAQSSWEDLDDLRKFWIRPEDIEYYEQYVDVCELYGQNEKIDILYDIYNTDKKWFGDLREIIGGLKDKIDSRYIVPRFVKKRVNCGRSCLKGSSCQLCDHIKELSGSLEQINMMVTIDKGKENDEWQEEQKPKSK